MKTETTTYTTFAPRKFSTACSSKLNELKNKLVTTLSAEFSDVQLHLVRQAVDEADALASLTGIPHLLLPTLAEEKVQSARRWVSRQRAIYQQSVVALAA